MVMENSKTPVEKLLAEMDKGGDFPALSRTISEINHAAGDENSRAGQMTEVILRDISLTKKLLRLVNAAHYGSFGSQPISTISRAVVILGFDAVRNTAISLMLFEHLRNHANIDVLRGEAVDCFFRGVLGRLLAASAGVRDNEEAFISALFRDLGRLMARFHFYEQTEQVALRMEQELQDEKSASRQVFGVDYDELGLAIVKHWHFPLNIQHAMLPPVEMKLKKQSASNDDRLQIVANMARELHRSIAGKPADEQSHAVDSIYMRYRDVAQVSRESLMETAHKAAQALRNETAILNVDVCKSPLVKQLLEESGEASVIESPEAISPSSEGDMTHDMTNDRVSEATGVLAMGMQDMTALMLGDYHLADIFKLTGELFYRSELFHHVVICVLDRGSQSLVGRVGIGANAAQIRTLFRIPLSYAPDVFHAATANGQDILISDASADNIHSRIPEWYERAFNGSAAPHAFLLLPIMIKNKPLGLIYADKVDQTLQIPAQLLGLLKALRNQAALALLQKL
jgi:HD-like signal output (HDOD) protein